MGLIGSSAECLSAPAHGGVGTVVGAMVGMVVAVGAGAAMADVDLAGAATADVVTADVDSLVAAVMGADAELHAAAVDFMAAARCAVVEGFTVAEGFMAGVASTVAVVEDSTEAAVDTEAVADMVAADTGKFAGGST